MANDITPAGTLDVIKVGETYYKAWVTEEDLAAAVSNIDLSVVAKQGADASATNTAILAAIESALESLRGVNADATTTTILAAIQNALRLQNEIIHDQQGTIDQQESTIAYLKNLIELSPSMEYARLQYSARFAANEDGVETYTATVQEAETGTEEALYKTVFNAAFEQAEDGGYTMILPPTAVIDEETSTVIL